MHKLFRTKLLFEQFKIVRALRLLIAEMALKWCDRDAIISYAQTGEDRIIRALLAEHKGPYGEEKGFYVDVGCNHPTKFSNTFELYKRGWRGISIDANQALIVQHQQIRPIDQSVYAVVSDTEKEQMFTYFKDNLVSSLSPEHIGKWAQKREVAREESVNTISLNRILTQKSAPKELDLLSIDVEGHDLEVLKSLCLETFRPTLIVIEMHDFQISRCEENPIYQHLIKRGYRMVGYVTMNGFFKREI